jgi:hypothetical protein
MPGNHLALVLATPETGHPELKPPLLEDTIPAPIAIPVTASRKKSLIGLPIEDLCAFSLKRY